MYIHIRLAQSTDLETVSSIVHEAAAWLRGREQGEQMWRLNELDADVMAEEVRTGVFVLAEINGAAVGAMKFELEDPLFWPDMPEGEAAFIHRLAVRRAFAGRGVSRALLRWAADRARPLGRKFLRLDCDATRLPLRTLYESCGFRHHSDRQVGPYFVARYEQALE